jgi:hypothetical protein
MLMNTDTCAGLNCKKVDREDRMSARTFEFHPFSSLAFHVQHLHLELLGAEGTQISLYLQQQWHSRLEFHRSLSGSEEFQIKNQCSCSGAFNSGGIQFFLKYVAYKYEKMKKAKKNSYLARISG